MDSFAGFRLALVFMLAVLVPSALLSLFSLAAIDHERQALRARAEARAQEEAREIARELQRRIEAPLVEADRALADALRRAPSPRVAALAAASIAGAGRPLRASLFVGRDGARDPDIPPEARRETPLEDVFRAAEEREQRREDPEGALESVREIERAHAGDEGVLVEALAMRARLHARVDAFPHNAYEACRRIIERHPFARDRDGAVLSLGARLEVAAIWRRLGDDASAARALEDLVRFVARYEDELAPREARWYREAALERLRAIAPALAQRALEGTEQVKRDREAARAFRDSWKGALPSRVKAALDAAPLVRDAASAGPQGTLVRGDGGRGLVYCRPLVVEVAPDAPPARPPPLGAPAAPLSAVRVTLLGAVVFEVDLDLLRARESSPLLQREPPHDECAFRLEQRGAAPTPTADAEPPADVLARERLKFPLEEWDVVALRRAAGEPEGLLLVSERMRIWTGGLLLLGTIIGAAVMTRAVWRERKASELKSDFVTTVTHELKTPLTSIGMFAETLLMGRVESKAEERECLEIIAKETERLSRLIDRVLTFSKIEAGRKRFDLRLTDMHELVLETVDLFETQVRGAELKEAGPPPRIGITVIHDLKDILCDRGSVQEVLLNLLSNAVKYGGQERRVEVTLRRKRRWAMLEVRDWGIGIPRGEQSRIFDKFYRTDNRLTREREGSGIGLTLAQAIARGHRGDITVRSKVGAGSTFTLWLPR